MAPLFGEGGGLFESQSEVKDEMKAPVLAPGALFRPARVTVCPQHRRGQRSSEVFSCCFKKHVYFVLRS